MPTAAQKRTYRTVQLIGAIVLNPYSLLVMTKNKSKLYRDLLDRQRASHDAGYFYESSWFAHAVFEDRTSSIVSNSGDGTGARRLISEKLCTIQERWDATVAKLVRGKPVRDKKTGKKKRVAKWPRLHTVERDLVDRVRTWTRNRNELVHKLANGDVSLTDADVLAAQLSDEALELTTQICAAARRVKKHKAR